MNGVPVAWCNVNDKSAYSRFDFDAGVSDFIRESEDKHIKAVTCFVIAPEYRGKGIATALMEKVLQDAQLESYDAVEGYPRLHDKYEPFDYTGPIRLYEKLGFVKMAEKGNVIIMSKNITHINAN